MLRLLTILIASMAATAQAAPGPMIQVLNDNQAGRIIAPLTSALNSLFRDLLYSPNIGVQDGPVGSTDYIVNPRDVLAARIGDGPFSVSIEGVGTLMAVGGPVYYQDLQGGVTLQYLFEVQGTGARVAVRVSPLYFEVAYMRTGAPEVGSMYSRLPDMPFQALFGLSGGMELSQGFGEERWGRTGVRAFLRPMLDLERVGTADSTVGLSAYSAVFTRVDINRLVRHDLAGPLSLDFALEFSDRGTTLDRLQLDDARVPTQIFQGTLSLDWRFGP